MTWNIRDPRPHGFCLFDIKKFQHLHPVTGETVTEWSEAFNCIDRNKDYNCSFFKKNEKVNIPELKKQWNILGFVKPLKDWFGKGTDHIQY